MPFLTQDSGNDVCLKRDGTLCVIMVVKDAASIDQSQVTQIGGVGEQFESKISRGINFNFMMLDAAAEPEFASIFGQDSYPFIAVLNPAKRKRFTLHEGEISGEAMEKTLDKILGGDARFKNIKGNKLPEL